MTDNGHSVYTRIVSDRLQVVVPYNPLFVVFAHSMDARWRRRTTMWSFRRIDYATVAAKLNELYGTHLKYHVAEDKGQ